MGRLIIDGNSFFEIDEECIKKKRIEKQCGLEKYLKNDIAKDKRLDQQLKNVLRKERGDG